MTARRKDKKSGKRKGSKDEQADCSKYVTLDGSETSDSDRHPTPVDPIAGPSGLSMYEIDRSKGAVPKIRTSRSWSHGSTSRKEHRSKSTDKSATLCSLKSNRTSPPRTRSQGRSPFRFGLGTKTKSKSPIKGLVRFLSGERSPSEEHPLLDHQDGIKREIPKKKKEPKSNSPPRPSMAERDDLYYYPPTISPDDEVTTHSSVSETSSVEKATGAMNIIDEESADPKAEECPMVEDDEENLAIEESATTRAVMRTEPSESSAKKGRKK